MGGEWNFSFVGDPTTIDVKKYQEELLKIRRKYHYDPKLENAKWFVATGDLKEPPDNIFAKFTYNCKRHEANWHKDEPGVKGLSKAWWVLYWDLTKPISRFWGDVYARCSPREFIYKSVTMQRHLAINFPEHFRCWLGDDIDGYGDCELYWGVKPDHLDNSGCSDEEDGDPLPFDIKEHEWFLESI